MALSDERHLELHRRARALRARRMWLYRLVKLILWPVFRIFFRPSIEGLDRIPPRGGAILAANHRSFFDSFFQAIVISRPMHWMGKAELFEHPAAAWFLVRVGCFPVRRGAADTEAIETARHLLAEGELVGIFPEGTRVREGIGEPKKGVGRLSAQTGTPLVPMAIVGTERLRWKPWQRREPIRMEIGVPVWPPDAAEPTPEVAGTLVGEKLWPQVKTMVERQETRRTAAAAGAIGAGVLTAYLLRRSRRGRR